jgi:eukaryotic-like serine/threonine-protein kinase
MRALEKDRTRRYETADGFARDVERYLSDEPVEACPPSKIYRLRKFARRNKASLVTATIVLTILVLATAISTWQAVRATREGDKQMAVNKFLNEVLTSMNPDHLTAVGTGRGNSVTVRDVFDEAVRTLDAGSMMRYPEVEAAVRQTIGNAFEGIGEPAAAEANLRQALALGKQVYGAEHRVVANCMLDLARVLQQTKLAEGELLAREALAMQHRLFGDEHPDMAQALNYLGCILKSREELTEAEALFRQSLAIHLKFFGEEGRSLPRAYRDLGEVVIKSGRLDEAEPLLGKALELDRKLLGEEHPDTAHTKIAKAELLSAQNKSPQALEQVSGSGEPLPTALSPPSVTLAWSWRRRESWPRLKISTAKRWCSGRSYSGKRAAVARGEDRRA